MATIRSHILACLGLLAAFSATPSLAASADERRIDLGGYRLNSLLIEPDKRRDLPPIVFLHGASTSLLDPVYSFRSLLEGRARLLFIDRPGHGRSDRGDKRNLDPDGQADAVAALMRRRGIGKAIIVSHSFGGAVAASFALRHPDMVRGLVFLSPAVYPWPGGIAWYYQTAKSPIIGPLFSTLVVPVIGATQVGAATRSVFAPKHRPAAYVEKTRAYEAVRPTVFRNNALEVAGLLAWTKKSSPLYPRIHAPTVIITGDTDEIVSPVLHSRHLARDISGAKLLTIHNMGHKSDYVARSLAVKAIETIAGKPRDLNAEARRIERAIAADKAADKAD